MRLQRLRHIPLRVIMVCLTMLAAGPSFGLPESADGLYHYHDQFGVHGLAPSQRCNDVSIDILSKWNALLGVQNSANPYYRANPVESSGVCTQFDVNGSGSFQWVETITFDEVAPVDSATLPTHRQSSMFIWVGLAAVTFSLGFMAGQQR